MPVPICAAGARALAHQEVPTSCIHTEPACTAQYRGAELGSGKLYIAEAWVLYRLTICCFDVRGQRCLTLLGEEMTCYGY